jgi:hypothetical protein
MAKNKLNFNLGPWNPRIFLAIKPTFGNYFSWDCHQERRFAHVNGRIDNFLNK